jgi:hypothetical protein
MELSWSTTQRKMTRDLFLRLNGLDHLVGATEGEQFVGGLRAFIDGGGHDIFVFYHLYDILIRTSGWSDVKHSILYYMETAEYQDHWFADYHKSFRQVDVFDVKCSGTLVDIGGKLDSIMWECMASERSGALQEYLKLFFSLTDKRLEYVQNQ